MPAVFAEAGMEHARKYGTTFEQFAKVSVKNHHHSTLNPKARYQIETPLEEVMNAEMISYPNTKLMCSVNVDGSAAAVLASEKMAKKLGMKRAVKVKASILTSDRFTQRDLTMPDVNTCTREAAKKAYEMAGVGPQDINLIELHDCFATAEILHYENLGICKDGEAGRMIDEKQVYLGGRIPGERFGRAPVQGTSARRNGHREHLRSRDAPARRGGQAPGRGRAARADPRDRARLGLRHPHPREGRELTNTNSRKP